MHLDPAQTGAGQSRPRRVTITDVAEAVGLAKGTVSRALNGYPDISEATRTRVSRAAERMGYLPMAQAQAIRTGRTRSIGLVLQVGEADAQRPFLADFLAGLTGAASAEGWSLTVATAQGEAETCATLGRLADERKADGFILPRTKARDPRIDFLRSRDVPFVLYGRTGDDRGCAWFDILGEDAMAEAVHRLHGLGHQRIGYIGSDPAYNYAGLRLQGYRDAVEGLGLGWAPEIVAEGAMTAPEGAALARELLLSTCPPTAFVCATDSLALGVCRAVNALGLEPGKDVSVISYDGTAEGEWADPPLTTFWVDTRNAGMQLTRLLIRRIRGEAPERLRDTDHASLIARGSDGPPRYASDALAQLLRARTATSNKTANDHQGGLP